MRIKVLVTLPLLLYSGLSFCEQRIFIQNGGSIAANISAKGLNRIAVDDDRILSVKGIAGQFQIDKDLKLGQIFIQPNTQGKEAPLHLFITTEKGFTYSLNLVITQALTESILLISDTMNNIQQSEKPDNMHEVLIKLIQAMHNQKPLDVYTIKTINKSINKLKNAKLIHLQTYFGKNLIGESYEIFNNSCKEIVLEEKDFYQSDVKAISILNKSVKPYQKTMVYIVKKHG